MTLITRSSIFPGCCARLRKSCVLSQRELARLAGLPQSTVARIESDKTSDPSFDTVQRLLGVTGCWLVVDSDRGLSQLSHLNAPDPI
jgi:transcriptional regulator with XRE-family HTH domain